ncbi:acyl carrier protein [Streptomyces sp. bgisy100]|uniref:acyl carrier protein n=1 Tax=Streptomyces sp. bgisy100 TaxID=3413783 RepID=UPI003D73C267
MTHTGSTEAEARTQHAATRTPAPDVATGTSAPDVATGTSAPDVATGTSAPGTSPTDVPRTGTTHADLLTAVREAAAEVLGTTPDAIVAGTDLRAEYGIDSLELMSIGAHLERALNVQISAEDLVRAETVGQAVELLAERKADRT